MKRFVFAITIFTAIILSGCIPEEDVDNTVENGGAYELEIDSNKIDDKKLSEGESESNEKAESNVKENESTEDNESKEKDDKFEEKLKIISTYQYEAETVNFNENFDEIVKKVHDSGGYVRSSEIKVDKQSMNDNKAAKMVLRVPKDEVVKVIDFIKNTVSISSEVIDSVDITDEYYNIEDKLESLIDREDRLIHLYKNATEISDIIKIDEKLAEIQEMKKEELRKKSRVDDRIVFSRVEINLKEVAKLSNEQEENKTPGEKLSEAFSSLTNSVKNFFTNTFVILIKYFPLVLILGLGAYAYKRFIYDKALEKEKSENDKKEKWMV